MIFVLPQRAEAVARLPTCEIASHELGRPDRAVVATPQTYVCSSCCDAGLVPRVPGELLVRLVIDDELGQLQHAAAAAYMAAMERADLSASVVCCRCRGLREPHRETNGVLSWRCWSCEPDAGGRARGPDARRSIASLRPESVGGPS